MNISQLTGHQKPLILISNDHGRGCFLKIRQPEQSVLNHGVLSGEAEQLLGV
jgi:hypothetical protein